MTVNATELLSYSRKRQGWRASQVWRILQQLRANPAALVGGTWLLVIVGFAVLGPQFVHQSAYRQDILERLAPAVWAKGGSSAHLLGTDHLGRDELSRLVHGAGITLRISLLASSLAALIGIPLGLAAGYAGGLVAALILRLSDTLIAFPFLVIAILVVALLGVSQRNLILTLGVFGWVGFARTARAETLSLKEREFVTAARATGARPLRIVGVHIFPMILPSMLVVWTFAFATFMLAESALSFLGFGVPPGTPSWGAMLADGRALLATDTRLALLPGAALTSLVVAAGLFGDALRDAIDPRLRRT